MGNCMDNKNQVIIQDDGSKPVPTNGQYGQNQQIHIQENEDFGGGNQQSRYQDYNYKSGDYANGNNQQSGYNSAGGQKKKIDFDRIGSNFVFYEDAKKYSDDSPWQRDENDNSNRPNELVFTANQRQPIPNGLAIRGQQQFSNQSMYGVQTMNNNQSMNRSVDLGYTQSVLLSNRKKQNIFYDSSTYNQNPYVKTTHEKAPVKHQVLQSPYLNFSAVSYR